MKNHFFIKGIVTCIIGCISFLGIAQDRKPSMAGKSVATKEQVQAEKEREAAGRELDKATGGSNNSTKKSNNGESTQKKPN